MAASPAARCATPGAPRAASYTTRWGTTALGARLVDLRELLESADVVSLHAPLLPTTRHMIGAAELARMRDGATFINTARGGLVDHDALEREAIGGRLSFVLDVTDPCEPLPATSPLFDLPNVVLTPHIAAGGIRDVGLIKRLCVDELVRYAQGRPLAHEVRQDELDRIA